MKEREKCLFQALCYKIASWVWMKILGLIWCSLDLLPVLGKEKRGAWRFLLPLQGSRRTLTY